MLEEQGLSDTLVRGKIGITTWKTICYYQVNLNVHIPYNPEIPLLGIDPIKHGYRCIGYMFRNVQSSTVFS